MAYNFYQCNREQIYLLPPSLQEWVTEDDLVWFIIDAVEQMELGKFYKKYRTDGKGQTAYEPIMMVMLILYAYCLGIRSSRQIERLCERDIGFKVITSNLVPDHTTVARFRQENMEVIERLFIEVLKLCYKAGLLKIGMVALDGSKMKANAAIEANRTYKHIEEEVRKMLEESEAKDKEEDKLYGENRGDELPEGLRKRGERLERLKECKERLEMEAREDAAKQQKKIEKREVEEKERGEKKRGRKPKAPKEEPVAEAKANVTDPDSRIMKTRRGYVQGYNGQAVVNEEQIIIAAELTSQENDIKQLKPMMEKTEQNIEEIGIKEKVIETVLADAGYCSEQNLRTIAGKGSDYLIATQKDWKQRRVTEDNGSAQESISEDLTLRQEMERKLSTKDGRDKYKKRGQIVEPVFGQIKTARGIVGFMMRGIKACANEWKLICATHNLLKLWRRSIKLEAALMAA